MMPTTSAASTPSRSVTTSASNIDSSGGSARARGGGAILRALGAVSAQLMGVLDEREPLAAADVGLDPLDGAVLELDDLPARHADHVVVMVPTDHRFIARLSFRHVDPVDQPRLHQSRQR